MYGAILGDMIGAPYEFDRGGKTKDFPLFSKGSQFTDDTVMTIAVAEALLDTMGQPDEVVKDAVVRSMQKWGNKYPHAGYGGRFRGWLRSHNPKPYGSYGNGSAMRVASAGWLFDSLEETRHIARLTAEVTHNHPEGIKGAEATACAIWLARNGKSKEEIRDFITREFGYDLSRSCDEIRPAYHHDESCQRTVPEAITAFLEGTDFEDVIRTAVSLGGDCDTLTCIAGSIAEAFYGVPEEMIAECRKRLTEDSLAVLERFQEFIQPHDIFLIGNEMLEQAISYLYVKDSKQALDTVIDTLRERMHADGHFILPILEGEDGSYTIQTLKAKDGRLWYAAFTSQTQFKMGAPSAVLSNFIDSILRVTLDAPNIEGLVINPWGQSFSLSKEMINQIFKADRGVAYSISDAPITEELLSDGSFLKTAIKICNRNRTQLNLIKLARILRDSWIWVPCKAVFSDEDYEAVSKVVMEAKDDLDSLVGHTFTSHDPIRLVPDILQSEGEFFFPVFTTAEEMGEYGDGFSKVQKHFLEAAMLARNNEKNVKGIVINAFTESFIVPREMFDVIAEMPSSLPTNDNTEVELFFFNTRKFRATGYLRGEEFVVCKDSQMNPTERKSCREGIRKQREALFSSGQVKDYVFVEDTAFPSPSAAASVIAGGDSNGLIEWKNSAGRTLKESKK